MSGVWHSLGPERCVVVEREVTRRVVCRRACVAGLQVTLDDATELGSPCGYGPDVDRMDNGLFVVIGHGVALGGEAGRAGLCLARVARGGRVKVVARRAVGVATSQLSVMVSRSQNRVCMCVRGACGRSECRECWEVWEDSIARRACCGWARHE